MMILFGFKPFIAYFCKKKLINLFFMLNFNKGQLAKALNFTSQKFWLTILPFYDNFPKQFKTQKVISLPDAKKLLSLLGYNSEEIETTIKNIK